MISVLLNYDLSDDVISSGVTASSSFGLFVNDVPVISGEWQCNINYNNKQIRRIGGWKESYVQDESTNENECSLFEVEMLLEGNFRLKRFCLLDKLNQIFIAGDLVLCDSVVGDNCGVGLQYESTFCYSDKLQPTTSQKNNCRNITFKPCPKLRGERKPASFRVIPLALSAVQYLRAKNGKISLSQSCNNSSTLIPLFFDFKSSRLSKTIVQKELTVGENLEKVNPDKAAGYRIQIDKDQFLFYRSLTTPANRTLLGHNLIDEICYAKFNPKSGVNPLLTQ